jgi:hypothetical protein
VSHWHCRQCPDPRDCNIACAKDEAQAERQRAANMLEAQRVWKARWPNHCTGCQGWGGFVFYQSHGPGPSEQMFDVCERTEDTARCHRCGELGLTEDGEGPCALCTWDFDDGAPGVEG